MPKAVKNTHITIRKPAPERTGICEIPWAIATLKGFIHEVAKPICVAPVGDHYRYDGVIAEGDNYRNDNKDKWYRLFPHTEYRSSERKKAKEKGDNQTVHALGLADHPLDAALNGSGAQNNAESAADNQNKKSLPQRQIPTCLRPPCLQKHNLKIRPRHMVQKA